MVNCLVKSFWHSESFHPTEKVLPSDIPSSSRQQEKNFPTTGKKFPDNWKKISFRHSESFLPTGKVFPSNRKSSSFRQDTNECPTYHQPSPFPNQKNRQPQHHNRLRLNSLFFKLDFLQFELCLRRCEF